MTPIATRTDGAAITLLVTFNEPVSTAAGHIDPSPEGFTLIPDNERAKRRIFATAWPAVRALRRLRP